VNLPPILTAKEFGSELEIVRPRLWRSRRTLPTQRSAIPFCQGLRNAVRIGWLPIAFTVATTSALNFASRSKIRKRCGCWLYSQVSCNCKATQRALGLRVTLQCRIRRRSWPITKKQYRMPKVSVGTVKKSIAAISSR